MYQSLAGGTGSGLGAHVVESLRDEFSAKAPMINVAIWPYSTGEVILQNYNVLLTLSSLLSHSDGILPIYNDDLLSACRHLLKVPRPSYSTMNTVLTQSLLSVLFPASNSPKNKLAIWENEAPNTLSQIVQ